MSEYMPTTKEEREKFLDDSRHFIGGTTTCQGIARLCAHVASLESALAASVRREDVRAWLEAEAKKHDATAERSAANFASLSRVVALSEAELCRDLAARVGDIEGIHGH